MNLAHWRDVWRRARGRGMYPHELAFLLTLPLRRIIQPPERLAARLELSPEARVLEIGPGPGYFSPSVAARVPRGRLVLLDLQLEMLAKARRRLRRLQTGNVDFVQASASALPLAAGVFDVVFLVAVLGEVPDPAACVASVHRVLRPEGLLSISEVVGDPDAIAATDLRALVEPQGFVLADTSTYRAGFTAGFRRRPVDSREGASGSLSPSPLPRRVP